MYRKDHKGEIIEWMCFNKNGKFDISSPKKKKKKALYDSPTYKTLSGYARGSPDLTIENLLKNSPSVFLGQGMAKNEELSLSVNCVSS